MDAFLGFLNNPLFLTLLTIGWGLLVKYHPAFAKWPNALIPYLNAVIALLIKLAAPPEAHAAVTEGVTVGTGGFIGAALAAGWQAILSSLIYEFFVKAPVSTVLVKPTPTAGGR